MSDAARGGLGLSKAATAAGLLTSSNININLRLAQGWLVIQAHMFSRYALDVLVRCSNSEPAMHAGFTAPERRGQLATWRFVPAAPPMRE